MVRKRFDHLLTPEQKLTLMDAAPIDIINGHMHHILQKVGRLQYKEQILELQRILWFEYGIDPIMGIENFVYAPMKGVHTNEATEIVINELAATLAGTSKKSVVLAKLAQLGERAAEGFRNG